MKKRKSVWRRSIYRKYVSWSWLQKRGTKFKWRRGFKHWSRDSPGQWFPETEYLRASAIFVSGTSGIPPILNHRSVSPIDTYTLLENYKKLKTMEHEMVMVIPIVIGALRIIPKWFGKGTGRIGNKSFPLKIICTEGRTHTHKHTHTHTHTQLNFCCIENHISNSLFLYLILKIFEK